jgi:hypothetical protein
MARSILNKARKEKIDEFYTQLSDIERELIHYREYFKGKTILCNCDDPRVSQFFYYFYSNFRGLKLKRLIATCYKNLNPDLFSQNLDEQAVYCIYDGTDRADDVITDYDTFIKQNEWGVLKGDGDFRSSECIELLKQADIVCSNPPFSLFREYVAQLIKYEKKFLIIGNQNAITYKDIFTFIKENKLWLGINPSGMCFNVPEGYTKTTKIVDGVVMGWIGSACWFTNLNHKKRNEFLMLHKNYNEKEFPKYDNFDAIEAGKVSEIPKDYDGIMGVPITFLDKYNPEQFEIIGVTNHGDMLGIPFANNCFAEIKGERKYVRILIKTKRKQNDN